jgi:hypothetical protein
VEEDITPGGDAGAPRSGYRDFQVGEDGVGRRENGHNRAQGSVEVVAGVMLDERLSHDRQPDARLRIR